MGALKVGVVAGCLAAACVGFAQAAPRTTAANLLDRVQIEDLLVDYYAPLGSGGEDMTRFYAPNGVLDINGRVYQGRAGVVKAYKDAGVAAGSSFKGKFHMLMTNPRIVVHGSTATADLIWTGIASTTVQSAPHLVEQGREHDDLVKLNGDWLITKRVITSDGGIPDFYYKTYKNR
jgi:hypothetical protein